MLTSLFSDIQNKVADINLEKIGREEIGWVEKEMPGLMQIRDKYKELKPLQGMRISGSLHITTQTAVLIETLHKLGATVRWSASNIYSTQDEAAAAIASTGIAIFAWKGETLTDYWWALFQTLLFDNNKGPTHIIDDKGDMALMIHKGLESESNSKILDEEESSSGENELNLFLKRVLAKNQSFWSSHCKELEVITEDSRTGAYRMKELLEQKKLLFPILDITSSKLKTQIDNYYSSKESLAETIKRAARTILIGKSVVICGYGDIGKGCAEAMRKSGANVLITETNPIRALEAAMKGYKVVTLEEVCTDADVFITATGQKHIIRLEHMKQMKDQAIICNMGHFELEVEYDKLKNNPDIKKIAVSPQLNRYYFPDGNSILLIAEAKLINLAYETPQLAFLKSCSYSVLAMVQMELAKNKLPLQINSISKDIDQQVAQMHLSKIKANLTYK